MASRLGPFLEKAFRITRLAIFQNDANSSNEIRFKEFLDRTKGEVCGKIVTDAKPDFTITVKGKNTFTWQLEKEGAEGKEFKSIYEMFCFLV